MYFKWAKLYISFEQMCNTYLSLSKNAYLLFSKHLLNYFQPCVQWLASEWQPCSASCGTQQAQQRQVRCVAVDRTLSRELQAQITNADCDPTQQPTSTQNCNLPQCPREPKIVYGEWTTGEWSEVNMKY